MTRKGALLQNLSLTSSQRCLCGIQGAMRACAHTQAPSTPVLVVSLCAAVPSGLS
jgi:hypothetical protein